MKIPVTREVPASADHLWHALINPRILRACLPGCRSFIRLDAARWGGIMRFKVGSLGIDLTTKVKIVMARPPEGYTLSFSVESPITGTLHGTVHATLTANEETAGTTTLLHFDIDLDTGQRLEKINPELIEAFAMTVIDAFFNRLSRFFQKRQVYASSLKTMRAPPFSWIQQPGFARY